jgi:hypothetical protein
MTMAEAKPLTQPEWDRAESFSSRKAGFPPCNWPYRLRLQATQFQWREALLWDPVYYRIDQYLAPEAREHAKGKKRRRRRRKSRRFQWHPPPRPLSELTEMDREWTEMGPGPRPKPTILRLPAVISAPTPPPFSWIDDFELPEGTRVGRREYLVIINQLMGEWNISTEAQFNELRPRLIKHALYLMGRLMP